MTIENEALKLTEGMYDQIGNNMSSDYNIPQDIRWKMAKSCAKLAAEELESNNVIYPNREFWKQVGLKIDRL